MRPRPLGRRLAILLGLGALAACRSPQTRFFTLEPEPPDPLPAAPPPAASLPAAPLPAVPRLVEMRRVGIPAYLDRPEIVRSSAAYRLEVDSIERWGEPLDGLIGRVLAQDLMARLPGTEVVAAAALTADPGATLEIDMLRFDRDAGGTLVLAAQVAVRRGRAPPLLRRIRIEAPATGADTAALAAGLSGLLGRLADEVAAMLRA